ncbi:MAG: sporulation integral membrane protein YtvI [Firmicutes bacterium HGW-Firmicutes-1]|jgi:sporulation integral membrane protein YtvI|nr:MAG: sporulation integral membrane protein YtvI [Firmicutes bacterium HGW-Firmicutes-1]
MDVEKRRSFIINFVYCFIIGGIVFVLLRYALPFISPFVIAFVIAFILKKPMTFLTKKCRINKVVAGIFLVVLFYALVGILLSLIGIKLFATVKELFLLLPVLYEYEIMPSIMQIVSSIEVYIAKLDASQILTVKEMSLNLVQSLGEKISGLSMQVIGGISSIASLLPGMLIRILFTVISTLFLVIDYDRITGFLLCQLKEKHKHLVIEIKNYVVHTLFKLIASYALIMSITFVELSIGLSILGVERAILIALMISIFDILPVLGTGGIMIPWIIVTVIQRDYSLAVGLLIVYLVIIIVRNILEPKIVGGQMGLHPLVTLMALFIGVQLFGVLGLLGLPITLSLLKNLNDKGTIHILK